MWDPNGDVRPDLRGIDLSRRDLRGVDLSDTRLDHAVLDGADLSGAKLTRASLVDASLARVVGVELDGFAACLYGAKLDGALLSRAILVSANMGAASLKRTILKGADLRGATLHAAELIGCSLEGAKLTGADIDGALVVGCRGHSKSRYERGQWDEFPFGALYQMYTSLMGSLTPRAQLVAEGCLFACGDASAVHAVLLADNWRTALAGIAACIVLGPNETTIALLWQRLRDGSWVAPQLAAAAHLLDPDFSTHARAFLTSDYRWFDKLAGRAPPAPPPLKSLISVHALVDRDTLPPGVDPNTELVYARKITQAWLERTEKSLSEELRQRIEQGKRSLVAKRMNP